MCITDEMLILTIWLGCNLIYKVDFMYHSRLWRVLTMGYNTQNYWNFRPYASSSILEKATFRKLDVFPSFGDRGRHLLWLDSLKIPNLNPRMVQSSQPVPTDIKYWPFLCFDQKYRILIILQSLVITMCTTHFYVNCPEPCEFIYFFRLVQLPHISVPKQHESVGFRVFCEVRTKCLKYGPTF
jgi:hypothetical protein